jgi:hypothetical protein
LKNKLVLAIAILAVALFTACDPVASDPEAISKVTVMTPLNYGNGVYYFPCWEAQFGKSLSDFIDRNPNLEFVSMAPNDRVSHGYTTGYFVVFREKK